MSTKAQHTPSYQSFIMFLREMREGASLTQRALAEKLDRPQSWVYKSETAIRRVDMTEFVAWCQACGVSPRTALDRWLRQA